MLRTEKLEETINFYTNVLGFTCTTKNDDWGWASLSKDDIEIMVAKPNDHVPKDGPKFTGSLYIQTSDVNELWNLLKDKTKVCYRIDDFAWQMREFAIYDNNGYILQFGQEITK